MLAKLKQPECYIGHGVFVFPDGYDYPVKRQISNIEVRFCPDKGWFVIRAFVNDAGWLNQAEIYMSKKEAYCQYWKKKKELAARELRMLDKEKAFNLRATESAKRKFELANEKLWKMACR